MPSPSIDIVKTWCRIDGAEFDAILPTMIAGATGLASHGTGVDYTVEVMPDSVQMFVAATVSYWLENPSANGVTAKHLEGLLDPHRVYS